MFGQSYRSGKNVTDTIIIIIINQKSILIQIHVSMNATRQSQTTCFHRN